MKRQSLMVPMLQVAALAWQFGCATPPAQHAPNFQTVTDSTAQEVAQRVAGTEKEPHLVKALIARLDGELKARQERAEADLRARLEKAAQERKEDVQGFLQSQANLGTKLDELATEARLARGRSEEIGHSISESSRRIDDLSSRIEQLGQRVSMIEKQLSRPGSKSETTSGTVGPAQSDLTDPLDEGAGVEISVAVRTTDPTLAYYFVLIQDKITGNWTPPRVVPSTVGTSNLSMKVLRSGQVRDLALKSSSGDRLLDDSALRAVRLSTPLPPLPPLFKAETLFLELQFTAVSDRTTGKSPSRIEVKIVDEKGGQLSIEDYTERENQREHQKRKAQQIEKQRQKTLKAKELAEEKGWRGKIESDMGTYLPGKQFSCIGGKLDPMCVGKSREISTEVGPVVTFQHFGPSTAIFGHYWRGLACNVYWVDGVIKAIACQ